MKKQPAQTTSNPSKAEKPSTPPPPQPINVVDGVPDAAVFDKTSRRRLWWVLAIFAGWVAFLIYCLAAARI